MSLNGAPHGTHGFSPFTVDTGRYNSTFFDKVLPVIDASGEDADKLRDVWQRLVSDTLSYARYVREQEAYCWCEIQSW